jgi:hypothetical protein
LYRLLGRTVLWAFLALRALSRFPGAKNFPGAFLCILVALLCTGPRFGDLIMAKFLATVCAVCAGFAGFAGFVAEITSRTLHVITHFADGLLCAFLFFVVAALARL